MDAFFEKLQTILPWGIDVAYIKLAFVALLPSIVAVLFYALEKKYFFHKIPYAVKQIIYGIIFGLLACFGTEWGIPMNGAQVNCRDAAVIISGLMFGAPSGIIAGVIGGVERWMAVAWGVGTFTRVACSVSTVIAGIYAALLRKFMFDNKKPGWLISLAIGIVMEVFHLTMVFITNMNSPEQAMAVVKACTLPMVIANGLSVMVASILISAFAQEKVATRYDAVRISQTIQSWLLVTVILAFAVTSFFIFKLQDTLALSQTESLCDIAIDETAADIKDASDANLISLCKKAKSEINRKTLDAIARQNKIAEVSIVNSDGIITKSTYSESVGYNMASGTQSAELLCLLGDTDSFVQKLGPTSFDSSVVRKYAGMKYNKGFIMIGYDADQVKADIDSKVVGLTGNRHIGQTGYVLILDGNNIIVSAPHDFNSDTFYDDIENADLSNKDGVFEITLGGTECYSKCVMSEGYYICAFLPKDEALELRNVALYVNSFMEILVFAVLFALIYLLIKKVVVNQIKNINNSLSMITSGNLNVIVDVRSNEEFASLSDDINSTVNTLKHYIDEAKARIDKELEFAKSIQTSVLPSVSSLLGKHKEFDIYAGMNTAKEVGGDFYDFYFTDDDKLHFLIADVSGKGIPAAMFMMRAKTELKTLTEADMDISEVFTHGNAALCEGNDAGMFVTAWQGNLDIKTGKVKFANAGHNLPLVKHVGGQFQYLKSRAGFVLAGMEGVVYKAQELILAPGDIIFLYTDGVTEATNAHDELYGEERLLNAMNSKEFADMEELCKYVKSDVDAFVGDAPQFDDITMVALKYNGYSEKGTDDK